MKKIIKSDITSNFKNLALFIFVTQVLMLCAKLLTDYWNFDNYFADYVLVFLIAVIFFSLVVYTIIIFFNYATKQIKIDMKNKVDMSSGYLVYRFIAISIFLGMIVINYVVPLIGYTDLRLSDFLNLPLYSYISVLFIVMPIYMLIAVYFNYKISKSLFSNIGQLLIVIGQLALLFFSGYLYYYHNPQIGSGILIFTIILLIGYKHLIASRVSNNKLILFSEAVIIIIVTIIAIFQIITGIQNYQAIGNIYNEQNLAELYIEQLPYEMETVKTKYGVVQKYDIENDQNWELLYLTTDNFNYYATITSDNMFTLEFNGVHKYAKGSLSIGDFESVTYDTLENSKYTTCFNGLDQELDKHECKIPNEPFEVLELLKDIANFEEDK